MLVGVIGLLAVAGCNREGNTPEERQTANPPSGAAAGGRDAGAPAGGAERGSQGSAGY
jgi:hypothetical protein